MEMFRWDDVVQLFLAKYFVFSSGLGTICKGYTLEEEILIGDDSKLTVSAPGRQPAGQTSP